MLTVDIRINGAMIGHLYIVNTEETHDKLTRYRYEYYETDSHKLIHGLVDHDFTKGAMDLIEAVVLDIRTITHKG